MLIGYARTSTVEQVAGLEAQQTALAATGCTKVFSEQASSVAQRGQLDAALDFVREGDTLVVTRLDRLARSTADLLGIVALLERKQVALRILDFGGTEVDTRSPTGRMLLTMFAAVAEFERAIMLERQRAGVARARAEGKYKGRADRAPSGQAGGGAARLRPGRDRDSGRDRDQPGVGVSCACRGAGMMVQKLFADATMALEDLHSVAVEGQRRDTPADMQLALARHLRAGIVGLDAIVLDIALNLGAAS